ncbi:MAG: hypothetical protein HQL52_07610 [Magnetococcales bacterium]|nr:hypothetical protein [Magnetococcales bacterium]
MIAKLMAMPKPGTSQKPVDIQESTQAATATVESPTLPATEKSSPSPSPTAVKPGEPLLKTAKQIALGKATTSQPPSETSTAAIKEKTGVALTTSVAMATKEASVPAPGQKTKPATTPQKDQKGEKTRPPKREIPGFAKKLHPIARHWQDPYDNATNIADGTEKLFKVFPAPNGDVLFSIAEAFHKKATGKGKSFTITPTTVGQVRLFFQVYPREAYMFSFNKEGNRIIPKQFWDRFAQISHKWVSVSQVLGKDEADRIHLRDIATKRVSEIKKDLLKSR